MILGVLFTDMFFPQWLAGILLHFKQEAGGHGIASSSPFHAGFAAGESEMIHGSCDPHVGEATFFSDGFFGIFLDAAFVWQEAFLHPDKIDAGEFESLG